MTALLEIRGLNTYYGESHILRDVDLTVNAGEMVCLIGRNGVGKTTLRKSLIGLLRARRGTIVCYRCGPGPPGSPPTGPRWCGLRPPGARDHSAADG